MPNFAANLSMLFTELPFLERFGAARCAGFDAVECQFPYAETASAVARALAQHELRLVLFNLPAGSWAAGDRGIACLPERVGEFRAGVAQAIEYALATGCTQLNCLAGIKPDELSDARARLTLIDNLRFAAAELQAAGLRLLIEPINTFDMAGFFLCHTEQALAVLESVQAENLFIQYDIYHAQRMEGELANTLSTHLARIAHIQIADNPGRHEPGTGEINYDWLLPFIDRIGYRGHVGAEYRPAGSTVDGLGWLKKYAPL
jgi:hydroxypyruvate isomerase